MKGKVVLIACAQQIASTCGCAVLEVRCVAIHIGQKRHFGPVVGPVVSHRGGAVADTVMDFAPYFQHCDPMSSAE